MDTTDDVPALNPEQILKKEAKEKRRLENEARMAEVRKQKELNAKRHEEEMRVAKELKEQKKAERAARAAELEEVLKNKREENRKKKEANIENMRQQQEAKKQKMEEKKIKLLETQKHEEEIAKQKSETTVLVTLDQQSLLDQIKAVAESSSKNAKISKINLISVGSSTQVQLIFEEPKHAKAFLKSQPEKKGLSVKMDNARPLAGPTRTIYFPFSVEPFADRPAALSALETALKQSKIIYQHVCVKGPLAVVEFNTATNCNKGLAAMSKDGFCVGEQTLTGDNKPAIGNPPKLNRRKRKAETQ